MSADHDPHVHEPGHQPPPDEHKARGPVSIECGIITCSDTRTPDTDKSGQLIRELLAQEGHRIGAYHVVKDEPVEVRELVRQLGEQPGLEALIINGGTGISRRDSTFEAVDSLLDKRLPGFGELFRYLSYKDCWRNAEITSSQCSFHRLVRDAEPCHGRAVSGNSAFLDSRFQRSGALGHGSPDPS